MVTDVRPTPAACHAPDCTNFPTWVLVAGEGACHRHRYPVRLAVYALAGDALIVDGIPVTVTRSDERDGGILLTLSDGRAIQRDRMDAIKTG